MRKMPTHIVDWRDTPDASCRGGAVTIGNFDGVHRGHAALIAALRTQADALPGPAVAFTFDPSPLDLLRPGQSSPLLTTMTERARLLHELGADHVIVVRTTRELLALSAEVFFTQVVKDRLAVRALVEGIDFGFGHNREGNVETLRQLCRASDIALTVVPPVAINGSEVSSSRIRATLMRGEVGEAAELLGRPYRLSGMVGAGQRRGQTIGFPTANLDAMPTLVPGNGVYAVRAFVGETAWPGAANIGPNPTFGEDARKVEVHLIGFRGELYGQPLAVDFLQRLRETRPFRGAAELIDQLKKDVAQAKRIAAMG
jgi:riboflavin kinase / FMN adenylyltransferase